MPHHKGVNGDDVDFDSTWRTLELAFKDIHEQNASKLSYEELYRFAYRLVLKKQGEKLYDNVKAFESARLRTTVLQGILKKISPALHLEPQDGVAAGAVASANERRESGRIFLGELKEAWSKHVVCMNMLADVLMYMVGDLT